MVSPLYQSVVSLKVSFKYALPAVKRSYGAAAACGSYHTAIHVLKVLYDILSAFLGIINIFAVARGVFNYLPFTNTIGIIHLLFKYT